MDRDTFDPGPLADVAATPTADGRWTLVFVRDFAHPPEKVWRALCDPDQLAAWAPFTADRPLDRVGEVVLVMIDGDHRTEMTAVVRIADAPTVLEHTWGDDVVRWQLEPTAGGTRLTLHHTVQDEGWAPKVAAGWHLCLVVADQLLAGRPIGPIRGNEAKQFGWEQLNDDYARTLGIEGASDGPGPEPDRDAGT